MTFARPLVTLVAAWTLWIHQADAYSSLPDDLYAYPKYSIGFLNGLPLPNVTAQHWLAHGLKGGEKEFLEQPWDHGSHGSSRPQITGGETINSDGPAGEPTSHRLERMRLGPGKEYLCLVPPPDEGKQSSEAPPPPPSHPSKTWNLLQPLTGKCLYHRQGWFTYSYCHNDHVRQFRETAHGLPHPIQGRIPEEDNEWEAYNLGVSPAAKQKTGNDVSRRQAEAAAANLELQRAADQRYLVQRWGDGTQCDKTGRKREIEIQFHCSMSSVDQIMFVKEVSLCNYLIVIHTPRICSEPGFKSQRDSVKAAPIRCRQVVAQDTVEFDRSQIESPVPHTLAPARPILPPAHTMPATKKTEAKKPKSLGEEAKQAEFVKAALGALLKSHGDDRALVGKKFRIELDDGVQELDFTDVGADAVEVGEVPDLDTVRQRIMQGLKAAGYDVVSDEWPEEGDGKGKKTKDDKGQKHAEL